MESPASETELFAFLDKHKIAHETHRHDPVFTVEEAQAARSGMPKAASYGHSKNLFVRDKKKNYALIVASEDQPIDLKTLAGKIEMGRLSFASAERLKAYLGVTPGSVTPFALFNAYTRKAPDHPAIKVILDQKLLRHDTVYFHPLHNAATTGVSSEGLISFIKACGMQPMITQL